MAGNSPTAKSTLPSQGSNAYYPIVWLYSPSEFARRSHTKLGVEEEASLTISVDARLCSPHDSPQCIRSWPVHAANFRQSSNDFRHRWKNFHPHMNLSETPPPLTVIVCGYGSIVNVWGMSDPHTEYFYLCSDLLG